MTLTLLVALIVMQGPCADAVSTFVTSFGDEGSASALMPKPGQVDKPKQQGELIPVNATEEEIKAAVERERARARQP